MTKIAPKIAALAFAAMAGTGPALAQSAFDLRSSVGEWLYDVNGKVVGSVYSVADGGRTVIVQYGSYLTPGRHLVALPSADLSLVGGHAMLRMLTADALASRPPTN